MWLPSWLRDVRSACKRPPVSRTARPLCLELLEDRTLPSSYAFTNIAETGGPFANFRSAALNAAGTVVFQGPAIGAGEGIFTGSGGPTTTIAATSGPFAGFFGLPVINAGGTVAFRANLDGLAAGGIFTGSGGPTTTIADNTGPFSSFFGVAINDGGTVAFQANLREGGQGIFTGDSSGGPITTLYDTSGAISSFNTGLALNAGGTVAFRAFVNAGFNSGIFTGSGGPMTTIADNSSGIVVLNTGISLNAGGTVAFRAGLFGSAIVTGSGGPITTIADNSGPFSFFGFAPAINVGGTVAFFANLDAGGSGIFTGTDPLADRVVRTGDRLFGSTVTSLDFFPESLNDAGQVVFVAGLADGRRVVVRADPVVTGPPSANGGGPYSVAEGGSIVLNAFLTRDPDQANTSLRYEWDFDGDGQFDDATGMTPIFSAAGLDGPAPVTVRLRVTDAGGLSGEDTVFIGVFNVPPTANNDSASLDQGASVTINVLANDTDVADTLAVVSVGPSVSGKGTVAINPDGTVTYTLNVYFVGTDSFAYVISDGDGGFSVATVYLTINPPASAGIGLLSTQVAGLGLNQGDTNSLTSILAAAGQSLANENVDAALNQLDAFILQLEALERSGRLDSFTAVLLIDQARAVQQKARSG